MRNAFLATARIALTAWVGAAALFVVVGIREVTSERTELQSSPVKDALVLVRFPAYYACGFALVTLSLLGSLTAGSLSGKRRWLIVLLVGTSLVLMITDYFWVYRPLAEMITPPGKARPGQFVAYHEASKWINAAGIALCFVAAVLLSLPRRDEAR